MRSPKRDGWLKLSLEEVLLLATLTVAALGTPGAAQKPSRQEFSGRLAQVGASLRAVSEGAGVLTSSGMSIAEVRALLGTPSYSQQLDEGGAEWCYGSESHLGFPTLGRVVFNRTGHVSAVLGGVGQAPAVEEIGEATLRGALERLSRAPDPWRVRTEWRPADVIRAVNTLQRLGERRSSVVVHEYIRLTTVQMGGETFVETPTALESVLQVLYGVKVVSPTIDQAHVVLFFPIVLVDDVPLLPQGQPLGGSGNAGAPTDYLDACKSRGRFRKRPLEPSQNPLKLLALLEHGRGMPATDWAPGVQTEVKRQILTLLPANAGPTRLHDVEDAWRSATSRFRAVRLVWSEASGRFVVAKDR